MTKTESKKIVSRQQLISDVQLHMAGGMKPSWAGQSIEIGDRLLSTEQAAQIMMKSRPYVAMLIDAGELDGASTTPKGHRRVTESSVRAWLRKHGESIKTRSCDYKKAARDAGMYSILESTCVVNTSLGQDIA